MGLNLKYSQIIAGNNFHAGRGDLGAEVEDEDFLVCHQKAGTGLKALNQCRRLDDAKLQNGHFGVIHAQQIVVARHHEICLC